MLAHIQHKDDVSLLVAPGEMGEQHVEGFAVPFEVVGEIGQETSAEDTERIACEMVDHGIELLIFVGGDGTARDVCDAIDSRVPVVAVPAGVKVFSAAFAVSARAAAEMVDAFLEGSAVTKQEVLDIDEEAFREDRLASRLYGYLLVPEVRQFLQPGKAASSVGKTAVPVEALLQQEDALLVIDEAYYEFSGGTFADRVADHPRLAVIRTMDKAFSLAGSLSQADVLQLQRTVGNQAVEQLLNDRVPGQTAEAGQPSIQRSAEQEEDLIDELCPGSKIRSAGQGRGEGTGEGGGPIGYPKDEEW